MFQPLFFSMFTLYKVTDFDFSVLAELLKLLRKKTYNFDRSKEILKKYPKKQNDASSKQAACCESNDVKNNAKGDDDVETDADMSAIVSNQRFGYSSDCDVIKERAGEKRPKVDFRNKLVLSPLTTVGNLPFRRICKEYGADITCGEMACVLPLLNGIATEWALARRHKSEDIFGVQLCGNNPDLITYAAQLMQETCDIDYIDLNIGCPIDLIYSHGKNEILRFF